MYRRDNSSYFLCSGGFGIAKVVNSNREFPAALQSLPSFVSENWSKEGEFGDIKKRFPTEATVSPNAFIVYCNELNSQNSKFPPWKTLQGLLWRKLYQEGTVKSPLYDDVLPALQALKDADVGIYIYSSGSIEAQKLLFAHTNQGDLRDLLSGCSIQIWNSLIADFDPSFLEVDNKFDVKGYKTIISQTGIREWTFFSDVPQEVAGAKEAGMKGYVVVREGNKPLNDLEKLEHKVLYDIGEILGLLQQ